MPRLRGSITEGLALARSVALARRASVMKARLGRQDEEKEPGCWIAAHSPAGYQLTTMLDRDAYRDEVPKPVRWIASSTGNRELLATMMACLDRRWDGTIHMNHDGRVYRVEAILRDIKLPRSAVVNGTPCGHAVSDGKRYTVGSRICPVSVILVEHDVDHPFALFVAWRLI